MLRRGTFFAKTFIKDYLKVSACGAGVGIGMASTISIICSPPVYVYTFKENDSDGVLAASIEAFNQTGRFWREAIGHGIMIGGFPVTYPASKLFSYVQEKIDACESRRPKM